MKQSQSSYIGRHAELYDLFYVEKPYAAEAQFIHECIRRYGRETSHRLLELACGTGNHALPMEKLGYEVIAVDYSADMIAQARKKGQQGGARVDFRIQDMRELDVPERPFDVVTCLFDSIGYVITNENLQKVLTGVHKNLCSEGLFVFEFWHAPAMLKYYDPVRVRRWPVPDGEVMRISETELDYGRQLAKVSYSVYELFEDGTYKAFSETQTNRYFSLQEIDNLLLWNGFQLIRAFSGFSEDETITDKTWHVVAVARSVSGSKGV